MTIEIRLSQLLGAGFASREAFVDAVDAHIAALVAHSQTIGEARPISHPLVDAVVNRYPPPDDLIDEEDARERFVSEYEFVDDVVVPGLAEKKAKLGHDVAVSARMAQEAVWPPLTRRLLTLKANAARVIAEADRTPEQNAALAEYQVFQDKFAAIELHLAGLELQIHALTDENVDGWKPSDFPV